ncbi:MAG: hypothetical protein PHW18_08765 [Sulfuricurvum sp.]|uniref:hypothetical protein n=1 Tax=Sulfuricurvum sp. TaxID=2025608 RepID=UPI00260D2F11|nr:hypothetical protein [Sulfuricurvum sp.]MDD2829649.1 hypothetical protein [Sulfuricurvum sp.]MDD4948683.1 hypothetical protein [Sulfuricurvum sp.]
MQDLVRSYGANAPLIQKFILSTLGNVSLKTLNVHLIERLYKTFPSLELLYKTDEGFVQNSPNIYLNREEHHHIGVDRSYLINDVEIQKGYFISEPYISTATGYLCITVVYQVGDGYLFLDFRLRKLLERFDLIEKNDFFKQLNRSSYSIIGGGLLFFGVFVVLYGFYTFISGLVGHEDLTLDVVFKPIIALTLGLAVYDLGKTIFEQEVLPRTQHVSDAFNAKTLLNFSVSIIIALLIEALLVVFKISIHNYKDLPYASTLIAALAFLLLVFAIFIYLVRKSEPKTLEN